MYVRRSFAPVLAAIAAALSVLTLGTAAWSSDTPAATSAPEGYGYTFKDDPLAAGGFGPRDARLRVVAHAARDVLIRPRTQFIAEMLKSVENL